jgi:outer membrane protein TolC
VADYNEARNFMITIENNIEQSKVAVNNVLSRNPLEPFVPNDSVTTIPFSSRESMLAALDTLNPAMIIARSQLKVLEQQKREVNSLRLPTVTLNAGASLNNSVNSAGFILRNTTYGPNASVQVAIPIFQGNVIKQNLRVNDVLQKNQTVQIDRLKNDLMSALANAYFNYNNAQRQYQLEQKNLEVVQENNVIGMERFRKASITTVELRQIQINLVESLNRLIIARYTMKQAEADVLLIMGKLVE